jgi:hypothetical protein
MSQIGDLRTMSAQSNINALAHRRALTRSGDRVKPGFFLFIMGR